VDPTDPNIVYAESQNGGIIRYDVKTGEQKSIQPQPKFGQPNLRWNWSAPIVISPHDHNTVYFGANFLFRSNSRGDSWEQLGGDLTRQLDRDKLPLMGKLWTKDAVAWHAGTAEFGNISTVDESPMRRGLLYVGTDDGLIQVSRDAGATWTKIDKFPDVPDMTYVSRVVASSHDEGTVYATFDGHRSNDFRPYVLESTDYGKTWKSITSNLPVSSVQVIREHPRVSSLLFVGNEMGAWYTGNGGRSWSRLQYNLPTVPVHDIRIHPRENDLVIGTHGRGIYIIDDITPLERLADADRGGMLYLFPVKAVTLFNYNTTIPGGARGAGSLGERSFSAPNPPFGTTLTYYLKDSVPKGRTLTLAILDSTGKRLRDLTVKTGPGMHRATWDLRLPPPYVNPRATGNRGQPTGAFVLPGRYVARLTLAGKDSITPTSVETPIIVNPDPLIPLNPAEYRALWEMRVSSTAQQAKVQAVVRTAELLKEQMTEVKAALKTSAAPDSLTKQSESMDKDVDDILLKVRGRQGPDANDVEDKKFQPSIQERVNQVAGEIGDVTSPPTQIQRETLELAMKDLEREAGRLNALFATRVPALNRALDAAGVPWTMGRTVR
jgi:hypothetical protein